MIAEVYGRKWWGPEWPPPGTNEIVIEPPVSREEHDRLKREVEDLKRLLKAAKRHDEEAGQADCEHAEKIAVLKRMAELVGVDLGLGAA